MLRKPAKALPQIVSRTMWSIDDAFKYLDDQVKDDLRDAMANF